MAKRSCPCCSHQEGKTILTLQQEDFVHNNPSYRIDRIPELNVDPKRRYPIVQCRNCQMVYAQDLLSEEQEATLYSRVIDADKSFRKVQTVGRRTADLARCLRLLRMHQQGERKKEIPKILDYGCGWGTLLKTASGMDLPAVGFDVTPWKVQWARKNGVTVCTSEQELQAEGPFDLCVSTAVLEHLRYPDQAVQKIAESLVPGGYCYLTCIIKEVSRKHGWKKIGKKVYRKEPFTKEINPWEHLNYFTPNTLARLMKKHGLYPVRPPGFWLDSERLFQDTTKTLIKRTIPLRWSRLWVSDFWQYRPQA